LRALGFAVDAFRLAERPFAWIRFRAQAVLQRTMVVHLAILLMNRIGGPGADFSADWKKMRLEEKEEFEADERRVDPAAIERR
jgi:hypothetical protein